eukprot:298641-Chlamydomonas_euryale.AAC.3
MDESEMYAKLVSVAYCSNSSVIQAWNCTRTAMHMHLVHALEQPCTWLTRARPSGSSMRVVHAPRLNAWSTLVRVVRTCGFAHAACPYAEPCSAMQFAHAACICGLPMLSHALGRCSLCMRFAHA